MKQNISASVLSVPQSSFYIIFIGLDLSPPDTVDYLNPDLCQPPTFGDTVKPSSIKVASKRPASTNKLGRICDMMCYQRFVQVSSGLQLDFKALLSKKNLPDKGPPMLLH